MVWGTPSSATLKSSLARVVTMCWWSSRTVAFRTTSSTLRCRVYFPLSRPMEAAVCDWLGAEFSPSGEATGSRSTLRGRCFSGWVADDAPPACATAATGRLQSRKIGKTESHLLQGCIVSGTGMNSELGQPLGRNQLYLQFTPLPVPFG